MSLFGGWLWWVSLARADHHVVRVGETVETIAASVLGDVARAEEIRSINGLASGAVLVPGDVLTLPSTGDAAGPLAHGAHVAMLRGSGTGTLPGGAVVPLTLGMNLEDGTIVCTDAGSFTRLRLVRDLDSTAHDDLSLLPNTCLVVESTVARAAGRAALVRLQSGAVSVHDAQDDHGEVVVRSEDGLTTGTSGGFRVTREETATRTEAVSGAVAVISGGQEVALEAGYGSRARQGVPPTAPHALHQPLLPQAPEDGALLLRPALRWSPALDFLGYRVELSTTPDFSDVVQVEELTREIWAPETLFLPFRGLEGIWWRVSVFDRIGFLGLPSEPRLLVFPDRMGP